MYFGALIQGLKNMGPKGGANAVGVGEFINEDFTDLPKADHALKEPTGCMTAEVWKMSKSCAPLSDTHILSLDFTLKKRCAHMSSVQCSRFHKNVFVSFFFNGV